MRDLNLFQSDKNNLMLFSQVIPSSGTMCLTLVRCAHRNKEAFVLVLSCITSRGVDIPLGCNQAEYCQRTKTGGKTCNQNKCLL